MEPIPHGHGNICLQIVNTDKLRETTNSPPREGEGVGGCGGVVKSLRELGRIKELGVGVRGIYFPQVG